MFQAGLTTDLAIAPTEPGMADIWQAIREEARQWAAREAALAVWLQRSILDRPGFAQALAGILADRLTNPDVSATGLEREFAQVLAQSQIALQSALADLKAHCGRDPACTNYATPLLFMKGFHAVQSHRMAHWFWTNDRHSMAYWVQNRGAEVFGVDIHPAARIGRGIFLDHATGIVIGETAVVADDVSMLHGVTLGGTGKESGDRHPKIGPGVLLSAGAKILGNVTVGAGAKVGAGSVVLSDVPPHTTVVGIPARVVGQPANAMPALHMDHSVPVVERAEG